MQLLIHTQTSILISKLHSWSFDMHEWLRLTKIDVSNFVCYTMILVKYQWKGLGVNAAPDVYVCAVVTHVEYICCICIDVSLTQTLHLNEI